MQVWTVASGKTARMASGKPFNPSTTARSTSSTPLFFISVMTRSQNLAPSFCSSQRPRISFVPSARTPRAMWTAFAIGLEPVAPQWLTAHEAFVANLHAQGLKEHNGIDRLERPGLPDSDLLQHRVGDGRDQVRRDLDAVELLQMPDDLAVAHAAGAHRHDLLVEARKP